MNNVKPLRILHIVGAMNVGGTETMLMNIFRNINRDKVKFDFVSYSEEDAYYDEEIKRLGGRVIKLSKTQSIKEIYGAIKQYGPYDVMHSHTLFHCGIANAAAKLAGIKVRVSHAHTTVDASNSMIRKIYMKFMRAVINAFSTRLLACSNEAGHYLFGAKLLNTSKYSFFPNLIDYKKFLQEQTTEVNQFKAEEGLENSMVIGHIGRFMEAKNHKFLLEIMKSVTKKDPNIKLLLVGDGHLRLKIEESAKKAGIYNNIRFVGIRDDIPVMLHSMDLFVFPSIYEGLGLVLLEAQASGVPCIVSEAIQPEADLQLGLMSRLSLDDGPDVWAAKILELAGKKEKDLTKIVTTFEKKGYSVPTGISKIIDIYRDKDGRGYSI